VVIPVSPQFTPVVSKTFTAPTNGVLYITGAITAEDHPSPGAGRMYYRLRIDATPLSSESFAHVLQYPVDGWDSGAVTGVVPVARGAHTVHLDARAISTSSLAWGREVSVLFVPNGQGFTPPA
jgi:hypothetical protein